MVNTHIYKAIQTLKDGGIIIYPTDTAFGIGCRIDAPESVDRLFRLRKRPITKATPILVSSQDMALTYFQSPNNIVRRLMKQYWPGALTIVAPCKKNTIYSPIRGSSNSIGIRMPNNETAVRIIEGLGVPIVGTSANFHGENTPYQLTDLSSSLVKLVDYVVPGECSLKQASTVVDCSVSPFQVIRQGAVILKQ